MTPWIITLLSRPPKAPQRPPKPYLWNYPPHTPSVIYFWNPWVQTSTLQDSVHHLVRMVKWPETPVQGSEKYFLSGNRIIPDQNCPSKRVKFPLKKFATKLHTSVSQTIFTIYIYNTIKICLQISTNQCGSDLEMYLNSQPEFLKSNF